ncbi:MAG TPA: hypothetical protein VMZ24_00795 [Patescibacteria group bacterium]|nr:hypothetical protein [Patescibacteria group bacterium]
MPNMKVITIKLFQSDYRLVLLFLLLCLYISACRDNPQPDASNSADIGTSPSTLEPVMVLPEVPKMPARRDTDNPLPQILDLNMVTASSEPTSLQMPALIEVIVAGRDINSIAVVAGRHENEEGRRLVTYEPVGPATAEQVWPFQWPDGIHDISYVWYTEGDYLSDGNTGDFVLLWQIEPGSNLKSTNGQFRRSGDSDFMDSVLMVDMYSGLATELLDAKTGKVIVPRSGDQFQITNLLLDDTGATINAPGAILTFGESAQLQYERKSLPQGDYFLGVITEGGPGNADSIYANYSVSNENLLPGLRAYLQPDHGFQLLYPLKWSEFSTSGRGVLASDNTETLTMQIAVDRNSNHTSPSAVNIEVLRTFGDVQVLYEDQVQIGPSTGVRTAYGYESPTGPRTGVLLSIGHDVWEYIIDVDGPSTEEATILNVIDMVIDSWIWRPMEEKYQAIEWKDYEIDGYRVAIPAYLQYNLLGNGWHRFSDNYGGGFFAIRIEPQEGEDLPDQLAHWLEVAGRDIDGFINSEIYDFQFSGMRWLRVDFQYTDDESGELWGAILATESGEDHVVAWFEAPEADYFHWEENLVTLSLADLLNE